MKTLRVLKWESCIRSDKITFSGRAHIFDPISGLRPNMVVTYYYKAS
jgi:hypothetical protein